MKSLLNYNRAFALLAVLVTMASLPIAYAGGGWKPTGAMDIMRYDHTATLLANGKVLVVGGYESNILSSAEIYDPATGKWTCTGSMNSARWGHTATRLANGMVLVAGGQNGPYDNGQLASAELYDPATGTWAYTGAMPSPHSAHTATLLANGMVLIAGGINGHYSYISSAELYDPATGQWTSTGSMNSKRVNHTEGLLSNGKVLVAGGYDGSYLSSAELYDPATGVWTYTGSMNSKRQDHSASVLPDGKLLVAGGSYTSGYNGYSLSSTELYDPTNGTWTITGSMNSQRDSHTASVLNNGNVLIAGGVYYNNALFNAELYNPATGIWTPTLSPMNRKRYVHTATLLATGKVLVSGGLGDDYSSTTELYDPGPVITSHPSSTTINSGGKATLSVAAWGVPTPTYQWYLGNSGDVTSPISGATSAGYITPALMKRATFWARATNSQGSVDSAAATVTVRVAPAIIKQPVSRTIDKGARTTLSVGASGTSLTYRWYRGKSGITTNPIPKATSRTYRTPALKDTSKYWVKVKSPAGSVNSRTATVKVR